jgi:lambda repressor-like predicted transcriptional regulator
MADEQWEESDGKTPSTDGEWFHDENGDWAWAYYDATLNTAWQARRGKLIEIVLSHPSCWELEEMGDHLLAEARKLASAGGRRGRPRSKRVDGERIKLLRREKGWSQDQLAVESGDKGIAPSTIKNAERGYRMSERIIKNLAVALGVPPKTLTIQSPWES